MLYAFTDESYTKDYYLQGAYVIEGASLLDLSRVVEETLEFAQQFGISSGVELRGYSIMNSRNGWEPLRGKIHARIAIYTFFLSRIEKLEGRVFIEEINSLSADIETTLIPSRHLKTQKLLHSKLDAYSKEKREFTTVIPDEITTAAVLKQDFELNQKIYPKLLGLHHQSSNATPGIQVIDLILYIYQRAHKAALITGESQNKALELWKIIEHLLWR